jgi:hypothetical protein
MQDLESAQLLKSNGWLVMPFQSDAKFFSTLFGMHTGFCATIWFVSSLN